METRNELEATRPEAIAESPRGIGGATKVRTRPKSYAKPTEKLTAVAALLGAGMQPGQALEHLGYSPKSINGITQRIKEKGLDKFLTEKRVKTATGVIDTFMQGKPVGRKYKRDEKGRVEKDEVGIPIVLEPGVFPKDTTVKDCAMSVIDRQYPKKEEQGSNNISFTKIDLTIYQALPNSNAPADSTPIPE